MEWGRFPAASGQEVANPLAEPGQQISGIEVPRPLEQGQWTSKQL